MSKNSSQATFVAIALGVFLSTAPKPMAEENPYLASSKRNAFSLSNEPPKREDAGPPPEPPKSEDIKLTGLCRHKGIERAALALIDPKKKSEPPKYIELAKGEIQGDIEIVSIDKKTGKVTVKEFGALRSLSFEDDTFKTSITKTSSKSSSRSSSSRSSESSKRAAEIKAAIERKKREEAARRSSGSSGISSRLSSEQREQMRATYEQLTRGKSDADKEKIRAQFREQFSRGSSDSSRSDRGRSDYSRDRGGDSRRGRGR